MKNYISILLAVALLASCSTKIQQPDPGVAVGEIYLTAPAGSKTVAVDLDGLWRVSAIEDWLSLDVNGRDGKGAFTFSYSSNESDFANAKPTRLGHIVIQSLSSMKADTLYVRQQGTPDGKEYESYDNSNYIEFIDAALNRVTVVYADFDGVADAASVSAWIEETGVDVVAAVCPTTLAQALSELYPEQSFSHEGLVFISTSQAADKVSQSVSPASLTVKAGDITYVVADFGKEQNTSRYVQIRSLLENGYNAPLSQGKWFVGGTFWYLSAMETGYPFTPSWYPENPSDSDFDADRYVWKNNLLDCVWMVQRDYTPTYTDESDMSVSWRPSYVYASTQAWSTVVSLEVLDEPVIGMKHKPFIMTLKY